MILFKIFQSFLLPSVFVLVIIVAGAVLLIKFKKQKSGKILLLSGIILYYFFSITPVVDLILYPLESQYELIDADQLELGDRIVLLTGSKVARASEALRLYFAAKEKNNQIKIIVSGVSALNPDKDEENRETREFLLARGVDMEDVITEDKSRNTFESAQNVKTLVGEEPFYLVTSAYHMPRSVEVFRKMGTNPIPAPAEAKMKKEYSLFDFLPNPNNLENSNLAFHEYFGSLYYKIKLFFS